jgi:drug/metabolite transporter (DMT)-like permease
MNQDTIIAILCGLGAMFGWGISDFFCKKATEKMHEFSILFWGQIFGAIPLIIYMISCGQSYHYDGTKIPIIIIFALFYGIAYALFYRGLSKGNVSVVSPTLSAYGGLTVLISVLLFHEVLNLSTAICLALTFIGVILVSINWTELKESRGKIKLTAGMPETLLSLVLFSFWYPLWDAYLGGDSNWVSAALTLRMGMAITFLIIALISKAKLLPEKKDDFKGMLHILLLIGLFDGGGFLAFNLGFALTSATSIVNMVASAYALPVVILAAIFLKEKLSKTQIIGICLIIASLVAINLF